MVGGVCIKMLLVDTVSNLIVHLLDNIQFNQSTKPHSYPATQKS